MPTYQGSDGRWRYRFTVDGRRYSGSAPKGSNTKRVAIELEKLHAERIAKRRFTGVMPTLEQFAQQWRDHQKANTKPLSYEASETVARLHILPELGALQLDRITRQDLDRLRNGWSCAPRTKNSRMGVLARILSLAVDWQIIDSPPTVKAVKVAEDVPRFLTDADAGALINVAGAAWRSMAVVALRTGMRIGELRGLRWADLDLTGRTPLAIVRRTDPGRPGMPITTPKGGRGRAIPLTADAVAALEIEASKRAGSEIVWPTVRGDRLRSRSKDGCTAAINAMAVLAELERPEEIGWHTLRHTFASWLVMRGVSLLTIKELMGHSSIKQTERYAHLAVGFAQHSAATAMLDLPLLTKQLPSGGQDPDGDPE